MSDAMRARALSAVAACEPALTGIRRADECVAFPGKTILHAGPPFRDGRTCMPIRNSARVAAVFEGWAKDFDEAGERLDGGDIRLAPAQDFNVVVPLASVASPSMLMQEVTGRHGGGTVQAYSPLNGGSGAAMRFGQCTPQTLEHLRWLNGDFGTALSAAARRPIPLVPIARRALAQGDDCHGRTQAATALLAEALYEACPALRAGTAWAAFLQHSPSFFLNLWMAACKATAQTAVFAGSDVLTSLGANGVDFGLQLGGMAGSWWTAPAAPPVGALAPGHSVAEALPAIGDSALVDAFGFGCMALHYAPAQQEALTPFMPADSRQLGQDILLGLHPGFGELDLRTASSAGCIVSSGSALPIALGILDRKGEKGRLGGGIALVPMEVVRQALDALGRAA